MYIPTFSNNVHIYIGNLHLHLRFFFFFEVAIDSTLYNVHDCMSIAYIESVLRKNENVYLVYFKVFLYSVTPNYI